MGIKGSGDTALNAPTPEASGGGGGWGGTGRQGGQVTILKTLGCEEGNSEVFHFFKWGGDLNRIQ